MHTGKNSDNSVSNKGNAHAKYPFEGNSLLFITFSALFAIDEEHCSKDHYNSGISQRTCFLFGIWNEEIDTLYLNEHNTVDYNGNAYNAIDYCELIHPSTAKTLATYTSDFYSGMSAVTVNSYGKGKAYYVAFRDAGDFTDRLTAELLDECKITSDFDGVLPQGVTAHSRTDGDTLYVFLQNFSMEEQTVMTKYEWILVDEFRCISGEVLLKPYETLIMSKKIIES